MYVYWNVDSYSPTSPFYLTSSTLNRSAYYLGNQIHPSVFAIISEEMLTELRLSGQHFFARKFKERTFVQLPDDNLEGLYEYYVRKSILQVSEGDVIRNKHQL